VYNVDHSSPDITTIFFDVGGVLAIDFIDWKLGDLAKKYSIPIESLQPARRKYRLRADMGEISDPEFWIKVLAEVAITAEPEDWNLYKYMVEIDGVRASVERLKENGHSVAILSNDSREMAGQRRQRFGFNRLFHDVIISSEVGCIKPHAEIYHLAARRLHTEPEQCLFIDDRPENTAGAAQVGMRTILFQNAQQLRDELEQLGLL